MKLYHYITGLKSKIVKLKNSINIRDGVSHPLYAYVVFYSREFDRRRQTR